MVGQDMDPSHGDMQSPMSSTNGARTGFLSVAANSSNQAQPANALGVYGEKDKLVSSTIALRAMIRMQTAAGAKPRALSESAMSPKSIPPKNPPKGGFRATSMMDLIQNMSNQRKEGLEEAHGRQISHDSPTRNRSPRDHSPGRDITSDTAWRSLNVDQLSAWVKASLEKKFAAQGHLIQGVVENFGEHLIDGESVPYLDGGDWNNLTGLIGMKVHLQKAFFPDMSPKVQSEVLPAVAVQHAPPSSYLRSPGRPASPSQPASSNFWSRLAGAVSTGAMSNPTSPRDIPVKSSRHRSSFGSYDHSPAPQQNTELLGASISSNHMPTSRWPESAAALSNGRNGHTSSSNGKNDQANFRWPESEQADPSSADSGRPGKKGWSSLSKLLAQGEPSNGVMVFASTMESDADGSLGSGSSGTNDGKPKLDQPNTKEPSKGSTKEDGDSIKNPKGLGRRGSNVSITDGSLVLGSRPVTPETANSVVTSDTAPVTASTNSTAQSSASLPRNQRESGKLRNLSGARKTPLLTQLINTNNSSKYEVDECLYSGDSSRDIAALIESGPPSPVSDTGTHSPLSPRKHKVRSPRGRNPCPPEINVPEPRRKSSLESVASTLSVQSYASSPRYKSRMPQAVQTKARASSVRSVSSDGSGLAVTPTPKEAKAAWVKEASPNTGREGSLALIVNDHEWKSEIIGRIKIPGLVVSMDSDQEPLHILDAKSMSDIASHSSQLGRINYCKGLTDKSRFCNTPTIDWRHPPRKSGLISRWYQVQLDFLKNVFMMMTIVRLTNFSHIMAMAIPCICVWLCDHFDVEVDINISPWTSFVVFPLSFAVNAAYSRRESALQTLGLLKASALNYFFSHRNWAAKVPDGSSMELAEAIQTFFSSTRQYLSTTDEMEKDNILTIQYINFGKISAIQHICETAGCPAPLVSTLVTDLRTMMMGFEQLRMISDYRTPSAIRAFIWYSTHIVPIFMAPLFAYINHTYGAYYGYALSILMSLLFFQLGNVQKMLENPFTTYAVWSDQDGINLDYLSHGESEGHHD